MSCFPRFNIFIFWIFCTSIGITYCCFNKQGEDEGISYRTGIYYTNESDLEIIQNKTNEIQKNYQEKVVVEIQPLDNFYEAEEYHQKYLEKNPQGYCHIGKCFFG